MLGKVGVIVLVLLMSGCTTNASKSVDMAVLQNQKVIDGSKKHSLMFEKVNGKKLSIGAFTIPNKAAHYVNPGNKSLDLEVTHTSDTTEVVWASKFKVSVDLQKGEKYVLRAAEENWCIKVEVVDSKGNVVAGPKFSPLSPFLSFNHMQNKGLMTRVNGKIASAKCKT